MNWLDVIVIIVLAIPALIGFNRGLIKTILPLGGIMLGIFLAGNFYDSVADLLSFWLESPSQAKIVGFIIIFVVVMAAVLVVASVLSSFMRLLLLGWVDKLGGLIFGLAIGGLVSGALLALITRFQFGGVEHVVQGSVMTAFFLDHFPFVLGFLPEEFDAVRQFFN
ncbi:MAG: CvpA family protein [Dehalococcoidia bacterium]